MGALKEPTTLPLHTADFYAWTLDQARRLREGDVAHLDVQNIAEEIESLGRSQESEMESRMEQLLMHLLKWQYQRDMRTRSWTGSIAEQRRRLKRLLKRMPSLRPKADEFLADDYEDARHMAAEETQLALEAFPAECPYTVEQVLQDGWLPD